MGFLCTKMIWISNKNPKYFLFKALVNPITYTVKFFSCQQIKAINCSNSLNKFSFTRGNLLGQIHINNYYNTGYQSS